MRVRVILARGTGSATDHESFDAWTVGTLVFRLVSVRSDDELLTDDHHRRRVHADTQVERRTVEDQSERRADANDFGPGEPLGPPVPPGDE